MKPIFKGAGDRRRTWRRRRRLNGSRGRLRRWRSGGRHGLPLRRRRRERRSGQRLALLACRAVARILSGHSEYFFGAHAGKGRLLIRRKSLLGLRLITGLLGLSEGYPRCGREIARRAGEGYDNQRQRKKSNFHNIPSWGKCPTSWKLVEGFLSRPLPEAWISFRLVGHCAARFSFFQGAATGMKAPLEMSS